MFHGEKGNTAEMNRKTEVLSREMIRNVLYVSLVMGYAEKT